MNCTALILNQVQHGQSFQYVFVYNFTNMDAMSHRSDFLLLVSVESIFKNQLHTLLWWNIWQSLKLNYPRSNYHRDVVFTIFKYLVARGYNLFSKWTCLHLWLERTYFPNNNWCLVGFNECRLESSHCLALFLTCAVVAFLFLLQNWADWQRWHHMYHLSSSSSTSTRTWDQVNEETLAHKSSDRKVKRIHSVGSYGIDCINGQ